MATASRTARHPPWHRSGIGRRCGRSILLTLAVAPAPAGAVAADDVITVATMPALQAAVDRARPGHVIEIRPGRYRGTLRFTDRNSGRRDAPVVLRAGGGPGRVVIDGDGANITVKFSRARHVEIRRLDITGGGYHGVFFDKGAADITLDGNRIYDNHRHRPLDSHAEVKGSGSGAPRDRPRDITLRRNEIFHTSHPGGGNFQGIDCNRCDRFRIVGNHLHDIRRPTGQPHSYYDRGACIQMKSASTGTVIDGNRLARCHIGIVFGGEGLETPAHIGGRVVNNVVVDAAAIGIAVVNVNGGRVDHNTLFGNGRSIVVAVDGRYPRAVSRVAIRNNVLGRAIEAHPAMRVVDRRNHVVDHRRAPGIFVDPRRRDLSLRATAGDLIDRGARLPDPVPWDAAGMPRGRDAGPDIGAFEFAPSGR